MSIKPTYTKTCMGFVQLPLMGWGMLIFGTIILILGVSLKIQSSRLQAEKEAHESTRIQYRTFVSEVKRQGEIAEKARLAREASDRKNQEKRDVEFDKIKGERDGLYAAYRSLRDSRSAGSSLATSLPDSAGGGDRICFNRKSFDSAVQGLGRSIDGFLAGVLGLIERGDHGIAVAQICKKWTEEQGKSTP
jgi:hypothetical protein